MVESRGATGVMSLEDGIAETLGVKLGDVLTYDIVGTRVSARVTSLRKVDWDSFRVNFFALLPAGHARRSADDLHRRVRARRTTPRG